MARLDFRRLRQQAHLTLAACLIGLLVAVSPGGAAEPSPDAALAEAAAMTTRGELRQAQAVLQDAAARIGPDAPAEQRAAILGALGRVLVETGDTERAAELLGQATILAGEAGRGDLQAQALNDLGNALLRSDPGRALAAYDAGIRLADQLPQPALAARSTINAARAELRDGQTATAVDRLRDAERRLSALPPGAPDLLDRLALGGLSLDAARQDPVHAELAYRLIADALQAAEQAGSPRERSWARGYMGELYALRGRNEEALTLYRQAALDAETARAPEVLYRWQWYAGRLLAGQGRQDAAIAAYRSAVRNLDQVRLDLPAFDPSTGRSLFRETLGPVFLELADLLLRRAREAGETPTQIDLAEARGTIERLKTVELEDYFGDDCTAALTAQERPIDQPGTRTAVLYPVLLADRTELILSLPDGGLVSARASMPGERVTEEARRLRRALELPAGSGYIEPARLLYDQLVRPVASLLEQNGVQTLVFVPDGALRNIPLSALYDGERFVAERWAVATGLGLSLLDTRPIAQRDVKVLVGGITESVQGFAALPGVEREVKAIASAIGPERVLVDKEFVEPALQTSLRRTPFNIIHFATHGEFTGDPKNSFVLTYDDRLNMDELEQLIKLSQFRDEPVDLLTLSACKTAAGDDRSALGLAGLAVKVGARSALATLWELDDESAVAMTTAFYQNLLKPGVNKAEALRRAQLPLLASPDKRHPFYWAPFLLIGNWE